MTQIDQVQEDLSFIRQALARRSQRKWGGEAVYLVWAVYVLIGYVLLDMNPKYADLFFLIGLVPFGAVSQGIARRGEQKMGNVDVAEQRRATLHWVGGGMLVLLTGVAVQLMIPSLRNIHGGQIFVILCGLFYFLSGVHYDGHFLWIGPLLIVGGLCVQYVPVLPWTCLGLMIAAALCMPYFDARRKRA